MKDKAQQPQKIAVPQQKTITGGSAEELDKIANLWLEARALKKQNPPMLGKAGYNDGIYYVVYYWADQREVQETT
jgi:hypothetical protein